MKSAIHKSRPFFFVWKMKLGQNYGIGQNFEIITFVASSSSVVNSI